MSYAQGTTHYNLPQTLGDDKRDWFDTNKPFADVDAALYTAYEGVQTLDKDISTVKTELVEAQTDIRDIQSHDATVDVKVSALETLTTQHSTEIEDVRNDCEDMVCALEEPTATAKYYHKVGSYFRYNNTLYVTTVIIAVGETIVPNVNCRTTDVVNELGGGDSSSIISRLDKLDTAVGNQDISLYGSSVTNAIAESNIKYLNGKVLILEDGEWKELSMGGGMPVLDYSNPIATIEAVGTTTVTEDCYLIGSISICNGNLSATPGKTTVAINGCVTELVCSSYTDGSYSACALNVNHHLSAGDVITITNTDVSVPSRVFIRCSLLKEK